MEFEKGLKLLVEKVEKTNDKSWQDLVDEMELGCHRDTLRKNFAVGKYSGYNIVKYFEEKMLNITEDEYMKEKLELLDTIKKEKIKVQTLNLEYNNNKREEARNELYNEFIEDSISRLKPIEVKKYKVTKPVERIGLLNMSDFHYGKEVLLKAFDGEIVNQYSNEEFKNRMWHLLNQIREDIFEYDKLVIFALGDFIENIMRISGLQKIKTGVVDSVIEFSEFIAIWLNELQQELEIPIEFQMIGGNHDELRILTGKKNDFPEEDVSKLIHKFIETRLKENDNIKVNLCNGVTFYSFYGYNVFGEHGEGSLEKSIDFIEDYYGLSADMLIAGHLHRNSQQTLGIGYYGDRQVVRIPSIIGACDYSKKLKKLSRAGSKFYLFSENGIECEKTYYLN